MTNEEAIYVLKNVGWIAPSTDTTVDEAIEMACKALAEQTEPSTEATTGLPGPCIGCLKECEGCDFQKAKEAWERTQADCSWK